MSKKYKLTNEKKKLWDRTLYRIEAIRDFGNICKGDKGGWIEKEKNLSHSGNAWVYEKASVFEDALVYGNAKIQGFSVVYDNAKVFGNAWVSGNAEVYGKSKVYGEASVLEKAWIHGKARVHGKSRIHGNAEVYGNANVSEEAWVHGNAEVYGNSCIYGDVNIFGDTIICGNSRIYGKAIICGNAKVYGNAKISEEQRILTGHITKEMKGKYSFMVQIGFYPTDEFVLYKKVKKISKGRYASCFDRNFIYEDGKEVKVEKPDFSNKSCSSGIHLSNPFYWERGDTIIACQVKWDDVITIQEGKVRVKKCYVIGELNDF